jgi:hypothetical protein
VNRQERADGAASPSRFDPSGGRMNKVSAVKVRECIVLFGRSFWEFAVIFALAFALAFLSCGQAGDRSSGLPCTDLAFTASLASPSAGDLSLQPGTASSCSQVDVEVAVTDVAGIFTAGFDLTYPAAQLSYSGFSAGPLLKKDSPRNPPQFFVSATSPGHIEVTMTRLSPDPPVAAAGTETLITLSFTRITAGSGAIDFDGSAGSTVAESITDASGAAVPIASGPNHGGAVMVP